MDKYTRKDNRNENLLIITQVVDENDDVLGSFVEWIRNFANHFQEVRVITLYKGKYNLPSNVKIISAGKELVQPHIKTRINFLINLYKNYFWSDRLFIHMCSDYILALMPLYVIKTKLIYLWHAHIKVNNKTILALRFVIYVFTPSKEGFNINTNKRISTRHGVNIPNIFKEKKNRNENFNFILLARISRVKRLEDIIKALEILVKKQKNIKLLIYGKTLTNNDATYKREINNLIDRTKLSKYIEWKGEISNNKIADAFKKADVFINAQGGGGFGKATLEAMSFGIPTIICTPVYNNILRYYKDDLVYNEGDINELSSCMKRVIKWDNHKKYKYSKLIRSYVIKNHSLERLIKLISITMKNDRK